jgi:hypothetical protein
MRKVLEGWRQDGCDLMMVLLAVLVLLVVALAAMLQPAAPIGVGGRAVHPGIHPTSTGGPGVTEDPYNDRHAEVVAAFHNAK